MKKKNKMLEALQSNPSARNLSSKVVKASESIVPDKIISSKYADESLDIAKKASEFDEIADDLAKVLEADIKTGRLPNLNQIYDKSGKIIDISKLGKGALGTLKVVGKVAGPLGIAADALASEDLGAGEESLLEEARREKIKEMEIKKALGGNSKAVEDFKRKSEELARTPIKPEDLLDKPIMDTSAVGEVESPDLEEMDGVMNYADYLKKRKRMMGYE